MDRQDRYRAVQRHLSCELEGEAAVLQADTGRYYTLNPTGALLWRRLRTPATPDDLKTTLSSRFEVDEGRCAGDVAAFLEEMRRAGLVVAC